MSIQSFPDNNLVNIKPYVDERQIDKSSFRAMKNTIKHKIIKMCPTLFVFKLVSKLNII